MEIYLIYKIDNHFKLFYNFKTLKYQQRENKINSDNFCMSEITAKKIIDNQNKIENKKNWGCAKYSYIKTITIT